MTTSPITPIGSKPGAIEADLRSWWLQESADWDAAVAGTPPGSSLKGDLWDDMPVVDSKAVARTSPFFERHLGIPLDVKLIRPGGYKSIEDVINDLVPKMEAAAQKLRTKQQAG